jgi:radical SAM protein with 4Fe4S-binding SPASM domain
MGGGFSACIMEHNGDFYSCDHFVEPRYLLGNINVRPLFQIAASRKQRKFGRDKLDALPEYCRRCEVRFVCNGECPKNRFIISRPMASPASTISVVAIRSSSGTSMARCGSWRANSDAVERQPTS